MIRVICLILVAGFLFTPALSAHPQAQGNPEINQPVKDKPVEKFSTGPVTGTSQNPDRIKSRSISAPGEAIRSPHDNTDILADTQTTNAQNETSVAVNPLDPLNIICVSNDYSTGNVSTGYFTTFNGGVSWTGGVISTESGFSFNGDPCVTFRPDGSAVIACMQYYGPGGNAVYSYRSDDGGRTFGTGSVIDLADGDDKVQIAADHSFGPHRGDVSVAWDRFGTGTGSHIYFATSSDGISWAHKQRLNDSTSIETISPDVAYGANSALHVMWADRMTFDIWADSSFDGGVTFGTDSHVTAFNQVPSPIPGSDFRMFDIFAMDADKSDGPYSGNVYVAYHHFVNFTQSDIRCSTSTDQGATWTSDVMVNHDDTTAADQVFPGVFVDPQGNANVCFYDRRLDANNYLLWTWVGRSSDGGATFNNYRASDVGWDHAPTEYSIFIGDYIDVDGSTHEIVPCWCDGRSSSQDVYIDRLHLNFFTDVDQISVATGGTATFTINIGPNLNGHEYLVLGTASGTAPGMNLPNGIHLPINWDAFSDLTMLLANSPVLPNTWGTLDATGSASAQLVLPGPLDPGLVGTNLDFAVITRSGAFTFATTATRVSLAP